LEWSVSEKEAVMLLQRTIIGITGVFIAGVFIAGGFAESQAGPDPICTLVIEINALRGGSPTVTVNGTKKVTAKARILKGTAVKGTTIDTTLQIDAVDGLEVIHSRSSSPHRLQIGRGGRGDTFPMDIPQCNSGFIEFVATFFGPDENGAPCESTRTIRKACN
jgi:hypothetical protein